MTGDSVATSSSGLKRNSTRADTRNLILDCQLVGTMGIVDCQ